MGIIGQLFGVEVYPPNIESFVAKRFLEAKCPVSVGRVQSDKLSTAPHPVSPRSASTPASAPTSLRYKDEDGLCINIWSEDGKKTVEIATEQEYAQKNGMRSGGDHIEFSSRGVEDKWKKLFIVMVCQLKKLPCTTKNAGFVPTLYIDGIDYLQDPELFSSTFRVDTQDLIDAIYSFVGTDGCSRRVVIQSILHHAEDAVGLYAVVAEVECLCMEADCTWNGEGKIVKISFMGKARQSEQGLIGEARSKAESTGELWALNHLPETFEGLLKDKYEERVMHITVFEKLHPLSELEDLRDFAQVFYDILQNSYWKGGHPYRHDLESLFDVMLCVAFRSEQSGVPVVEPRAYLLWFSGTDRKILDKKHTFLTDPFVQSLHIQSYFTGFKRWETRIIKSNEALLEVDSKAIKFCMVQLKDRNNSHKLSL
ncbi:hypothetical protein F5876DRAFT_68622 [Lentinula aff. lateritia]|uniref:Uncharacterized protein n=1 Tax=Lentinula aff. lateritia TaxID=2804960 RepID=A0ACC1TQ15_9AGAR|nr:hypothetical protein F5876DRAFT_68622 [Lentinula aff. lateritia]